MDCHGNRPDVTIWACVFHFCLFLIFRLEDLDREEGERERCFKTGQPSFILLRAYLKKKFTSPLVDVSSESENLGIERVKFQDFIPVSRM